MYLCSCMFVFHYLVSTVKYPNFLIFFYTYQLPRATSTSALSGGGLKRLVKNVGDTMFHLTTKMSESDAVGTFKFAYLFVAKTVTVHTCMFKDLYFVEL